MLLLLLLPVPLVVMTAVFPASQGLNSFRLIQASSFANHTWAQTQASGWLDDVQILSWDRDEGKVVFLKPWSKGNFSDKEVTEVETIFRIYFSGFTTEVKKRVDDFQLEYPFQIQMTGGCELLPGDAIMSFLWGALGGQDVLSIQNTSCVPTPEGGSRVQKFCSSYNQLKGIRDIVENLLVHTCPRFLLGVLAAGRADLQRQVKPEAWLSSGPHPEPGRLLLVCHVSGFHPKPVWAMWMRGEQELPGAQPGDVLPQADGTWYLRVTLDVAAQEAAGLSCRVKHSSLGGQDLVLYWGRSLSTGLIILAALVSCLILVGFALWFRRRRSYQDI